MITESNLDTRVVVKGEIGKVEEERERERKRERELKKEDKEGCSERGRDSYKHTERYGVDKSDKQKMQRR